jgi:DNA polymerase
VNRGGCDLRTAGAWRYCADPQTEILTLAYRFGIRDVRLWTPAMGLCAPLAWYAARSSIEFICFSDFELAVWDRIMVARFGFPPIAIERWNHTQAACSFLALPRALDKTLTAIGSEVVKDAAGNRLVLSLSRPHRKTGEYPEITPAVLDRVFAYNKIDVDGLMSIHAAVGDLEGRERELWNLDQAINQRGVRIDLDFVRGGKRIAESSKGVLIDEFGELTGGISPYQVEKTRDWLTGRGFNLPSLEEDVIEALETLVLPDDIRRALEIRRIVGPTSLKKLDAMLTCAGADDRARGLFQYHAATSSRWSSSIIQLQNLPRPTIEVPHGEIEELVGAVKTGEAAALERWGSPIEALVGALCYALVAADGALFGVGDFSMIETCVLLALAGQRDKCKLIEDGVDVYRDMAAMIYGLDRDAFLAIPKSELTIEQRQQRQAGGKNPVLGCGYGLGSDKFRLRYCRHMPLEEGKTFADAAVYNYRKRWAPLVPKLWYNLERTARRAMLQPGIEAVGDCGITYRLEIVAGLPCLVCRLLNGKRLHYQNAQIVPNRVDHFGYPIWTYWAYRKGRWCDVEPYGSQLTQNIIEALARELLVDAMLRFEARGFPVIMHCHDEIVVEHPEITEALMIEIMEEREQWAIDLGVPVKVEAWTGKRYRK